MNGGVMDSAMRDLERIRERDDGEAGRGRALFALAGITTATLVLALFLQLDAPVEAELSEATDPIASLDPQRLAAPHADRALLGMPERALPEIDRVALTFPETLSGADRPEVAAALAAAAAELRHPDPIQASRRPTLSAPLLPATTRDAIEERLPSTLPAAMAAAGGSALSHSAPHDPMLLRALPPAEQVGERAPEGHDGEYTVQVISYDTAEGAQAFAAGLRARGHRAFVMRAEVEDRGTVFRVRIGPFETMAEAQAYRRSFEDSERMNTIVVRRR
jgi:DedD protein